MKTFNEIFQEIKLKFPDIKLNEQIIKAREKYIFENNYEHEQTIRNSINSIWY